MTQIHIEYKLLILAIKVNWVRSMEKIILLK